MSKRIRTTKPSDTETMEMNGSAMSPAMAVAAASADDKLARVGGGVATRPRLGSFTNSVALTNGKAKAANATTTTLATAADSQPNKHVMLPAFLSKTFEIFSMSEFANVCGWNATGDTIIVSQLEAFVAMVLPRFFKHRNFPSFVRQLNLYGFHKTVLDSKRLEFQHPYFKRDRPDLLHYIKRKVSTASPAAQQQQQQSSSRLEAHREISDQLVKEMKELRNRSDTMEKRLRELEIDNAIVRSDNMKLWKHLEAAKDKQLIMHEKMKKIMWILFQIYRGKQAAMPKLGGHSGDEAITEDYINSSRLGPKEFRDVLRFLAMDEPALLPHSSTAAGDSTALNTRKRKFVEVPSSDASFGDELFKLGSSSVEEIGSPVRDVQSTVPTPTSAAASAAVAPNNVLSIFTPHPTVPRISPSDLPFFSPPSMSSSALTEVTNTAASSAPTTSALTTTTPSKEAAAASTGGLDFIDEDLPLLNDSDHFSFGEGAEQHVMQKLEDFESSLLDEYDVGCLDTLLQQLKAANAEKTLALPPLDPDEISAGGPEDGAHASS